MAFYSPDILTECFHGILQSLQSDVGTSAQLDQDHILPKIHLLAYPS
jgi:hypothetical protein